MFEDESSITNYAQLKKFIMLENSNESRNTEFKEGHEWELLKYKITRALLGLSNIKYGGKVIIGIKAKNNSVTSLTGMTLEKSKTYTLDKIKEFVNKYADPALELKLHKMDYMNQKYFIVITVREFSEMPTICKKDAQGKELQQNKIYIRPSTRIETSDNFTTHDMRKLIDLAVEKEYIKQIKKCEKFEKMNKIKRTLFDEEMSDL